jgi:type IV pilus modification protein PilV
MSQALKLGKKGFQSGFTLIETMVAALVLLVGLMSVAQLILMAALYNSSSKQTTMATMLAAEKMEELLAAPLSSPQLNYSAHALGVANQTVGYFERVVADPGTKRFRKATASEAANYTITWVVQPDNSATPMPGLRRITVRAEAMRAALTGDQVRGAKQPEVAEISSIRTPPQ